MAEPLFLPFGRIRRSRLSAVRLGIRILRIDSERFDRIGDISGRRRGTDRERKIGSSIRIDRVVLVVSDRMLAPRAVDKAVGVPHPETEVIIGVGRIGTAVGANRAVCQSAVPRNSLIRHKNSSFDRIILSLYHRDTANARLDTEKPQNVGYRLNLIFRQVFGLL